MDVLLLRRNEALGRNSIEAGQCLFWLDIAFSEPQFKARVPFHKRQNRMQVTAASPKSVVDRPFGDIEASFRNIGSQKRTCVGRRCYGDVYQSDQTTLVSINRSKGRLFTLDCPMVMVPGLQSEHGVEAVNTHESIHRSQSKLWNIREVPQTQYTPGTLASPLLQVDCAVQFQRHGLS